MLKKVQEARLDTLQRFRLTNLSARMLGAGPRDIIHIYYDTATDNLILTTAELNLSTPETDNNNIKENDENE